MARDVILHVDDDTNDVVLFQHAARKAGLNLRMLTVADGEEVFAYLGGTGKYANREEFPIPDLMMLDLKMPRVSGFDVLAWVRRQENLRRLPILVLTSSNHSADIQRAYELGANSYIVKPVGFEALVALTQVVHQYWLRWNEPAPF
jgi:CheY-like chemotaxis protein